MTQENSKNQNGTPKTHTRIDGRTSVIGCEPAGNVAVRWNDQGIAEAWTVARHTAAGVERRTYVPEG